MKDLRVLFAPSTEQAYIAHLADADGSLLGVEVPFTPSLEEDDYEDLRWYLEEYMELPDGGAVVRAQRIEGNLETWGRKLHDFCSRLRRTAFSWINSSKNRSHES